MLKLYVDAQHYRFGLQIHTGERYITIPYRPRVKERLMLNLISNIGWRVKTPFIPTTDVLWMGRLELEADLDPATAKQLTTILNALAKCNEKMRKTEMERLSTLSLDEVQKELALKKLLDV